eukprot:4656735-Prymnesium_polylepis.1
MWAGESPTRASESSPRVSERLPEPQPLCKRRSTVTFSLSGGTPPELETRTARVPSTSSKGGAPAISRDRSFSWGFRNEEEELTFSMTLSASERTLPGTRTMAVGFTSFESDNRCSDPCATENLAGRGLAAMLPIVDEQDEPPSEWCPARRRRTRYHDPPHAQAPPWPTSERRRLARRAPGAADATVRRVLTMKLDKRALRMRGGPGR